MPLLNAPALGRREHVYVGGGGGCCLGDHFFAALGSGIEHLLGRPPWREVLAGRQTT